MKTRTQIIFRIKELKDRFDIIKNYSYSKKEQFIILFEVEILEGVLINNIKPNKLITNIKKI